MPGRFEGKSAIITGAARGIGLGITRCLAGQGARILLVDRDEGLLAKAVQALRGEGGDVRALCADVSKIADMRLAADTALEAFGQIDILCPNAAVFDASPLVTMPEDLWDRLLNINLKGVFLSVQACLPHMMERRYGRIVVTSSITGNRTAIAGMAHYAASKGGITGFVKAAAIELARHGITINTVEPGHVMTEGAAPQYDAEFKAAVEAFIPIGRFGLPEDIGKAVLFLASDDAAYVTGQSVTVDGGVTLPEYPPGFPRAG
ncbi:MAG TPA: SDR family oxidoreductase [Nordella sp.]|nr:SDR family oxidoreductase [Nordella sp.]